MEKEEYGYSGVVNIAIVSMHRFSISAVLCRICYVVGMGTLTKAT